MILVTGASGFIGNYLYTQLKSLGLKVLPLDYAADVHVTDQQLECDLACPDHLEKIRKAAEVPETIIHLAGYVDIALRVDPGAPSAPPLPGRENISKIYAANVGATANLLDYCLNSGVRHLIFASSQTVYGMPQSYPLTEESPCNPLEHYAMSKLCCEQLLRIGGRQGLAVTILRFPGVFSEERQSGVVFQFCRQAIQSGEIFVRADYPLPLDVIHLADVANACIKAASWGGQEEAVCLNVATGEPCNLNILADAIAEHVPGCIVHHSELPQPVVCMDSSKAYDLFGWRAVPRSQRFQAMIETLRKNSGLENQGG